MYLSVSIQHTSISTTTHNTASTSATESTGTTLANYNTATTCPNFSFSTIETIGQSFILGYCHHWILGTEALCSSNHTYWWCSLWLGWRWKGPHQDIMSVGESLWPDESIAWSISVSPATLRRAWVVMALNAQRSSLETFPNNQLPQTGNCISLWATTAPISLFHSSRPGKSVLHSILTSLFPRHTGRWRPVTLARLDSSIC